MRIAKAATLSIVLLLGLGIIGIVSAANPHEGGSTGQPDKTCGSECAADGPGYSPNAPGSAFNEVDGVAGGVYAGNGANTNTPANGNAVSQYDVGCYEVSQESRGQTTPEPPV